MNNVLNNLIIYNGYPLSVVVALVFHILIFVALIYFQSVSEADSLELVQPTIIKALFIDENPQVRNRIEQQRAVELQRQQEQDRERQRQEAERQRQEEQQREAAERQRLEEEQRQAALREREELERQRAEQLQRERLLEEQQRRQNEAVEEQRRRQQALERQRAAEAAAAEAAAAEAARNEFELVQSATGLIQQIVQENWSRPPSARNGMRAILQIQMLPTGELLDVNITQSSGDPAFDRSAENAVYRAAPFSELQSLPINVFNANFRTLSLVFEPEDLLN